jgi:pyruvate/2-oxoglutarate dehydrogenase complex dihydrolipoamide acyltransferase (E2) component
MSEPATIELKLADVGEGIAEAEIVEWLVRPGDIVKADQPVVVVMTDKASVEIPAPVDGIVRECVGEPGTIVPTGSVLLRMEGPAHIGPAHAIQAAPSTRRIAAQLGVDLHAVTGSGPGGRILREDVERHGASGPLSASAPAAVPLKRRDDGVEIIPLRGLRRQSAHAVALAWRTVPSIAEFRDVDATELVRVRREMREQGHAAAPPLTYLPFFVRAVATALLRHPNFNGSIDLERNEITIRTACHIGIATATDDGLIVPVLHDAATMSLRDIAAALDALIGRARAGRLQPADLTGGSVTITNFGSYGTEFGIPIVRASEAAIVGFGGIRDAVVAVDGVPAIRLMLPLTVAADHRLNDGAELAAFTATIAAGCRDPVQLLGL